MSDQTAAAGGDSGGIVTSAHIAQAEAEVGGALERELPEYFALIARVTDFMGRTFQNTHSRWLASRFGAVTDEARAYFRELGLPERTADDEHK